MSRICLCLGYVRVQDMSVQEMSVSRLCPCLGYVRVQDMYVSRICPVQDMFVQVWSQHHLNSQSCRELKKERQRARNREQEERKGWHIMDLALLPRIILFPLYFLSQQIEKGVEGFRGYRAVRGEECEWLSDGTPRMTIFSFYLIRLRGRERYGGLRQYQEVRGDGAQGLKNLSFQTICPSAIL